MSFNIDNKDDVDLYGTEKGSKYVKHFILGFTEDELKILDDIAEFFEEGREETLTKAIDAYFRRWWYYIEQVKADTKEDVSE